jgi:multicomponent Na+:H+ antiporter subunit E
MTASAQITPRARLGPLLWRALWLAVLWLALNGADHRSWIVGAPVVCVAAWVSLRMRPATRWRLSPLGAVAFAAYFARESFLGGLDVARRAFAPRLSLAPAMRSFRPRLAAGTPRLFLCAVISLLPGTAVVEIAEDHLLVHVLDDSSEVEGELRALEDRVAALFALGRLEAREREQSK